MLSTAGSSLEHLDDERLLTDLAGCVQDFPLQLGALFQRLVVLVGSSEASRRWLAIFAAIDAAST